MSKVKAPDARVFEKQSLDALLRLYGSSHEIDKASLHMLSLNYNAGVKAAIELEKNGYTQVDRNGVERPSAWLSIRDHSFNNFARLLKLSGLAVIDRKSNPHEEASAQDIFAPQETLVRMLKPQDSSKPKRIRKQ